MYSEQVCMYVYSGRVCIMDRCACLYVYSGQVCVYWTGVYAYV